MRCKTVVFLWSHIKAFKFQTGLQLGIGGFVCLFFRLKGELRTSKITGSNCCIALVHRCGFYRQRPPILSICEQVFNHHERSQLHHHFLHDLLHFASRCDILLLWETPSEAKKGQFLFSAYGKCYIIKMHFVRHLYSVC